MQKMLLLKSTPVNQTANVYYLVNKSDVRASEMKSDEIKNLNTFIKKTLITFGMNLKISVFLLTHLQMVSYH
jgi:hypothetical protein